MIDFLCDQVNKRVLIRDDMRVLGELAYQVEVPGDWLNPLLLEREDTRVRVTLGRPGGREVVIEDEFSLAADQISIRRTWFLPDGGSYRLLFDYRAQEEGVATAVLPGITYASFFARSPAPAFSAPSRMLSFPGAAFGTQDRVFALVVEADDSFVFDTSIHLYESERMAAVQTRMPGSHSIATTALGAAADSPPTSTQEEWLTPRHLPKESLFASFTLILNGTTPGEVLARANELVWTGSRSVSREPPLTFSRFREEKLRHVNRHVAKSNANIAQCIRPADDEKRARPPRVVSALAPYWSMIAARVFIQEGRRTSGSAYVNEGTELVARLLEGRRRNGLFCDVLDLESQHWGSYLDGEFVPGHVSIVASSTIARHLAEIYAELRGARIDRPKLIRMASDAASVLIDSVGPESLWWEESHCEIATASVLSLLVRLESIKGRNSLRRTAIKRSADSFLRALGKPETLGRTASVREDLTTVTRAALDLGFYLRDESSIRAAKENAAILSSWVFARDRVFPKRSRAERLGIRTRGLVGCATDRRHLSFDGLPVAYELARAARLTGINTFARIAQAMCLSNRQCVGGYVKMRHLPDGAQPAELDIMEWSSRRRDAKATGSVLGNRIAQSIEATFASTLLLEHYPEIANFSSSAS
ncbi:MAG: hypothetical protein ACLFP4_04140 [Spirochaetales bacterium]